MGVLGIPFDGATSFRKGASMAPKRIREITPHMAPATEEGVRLSGLKIKDYGDIYVDLDWGRYFKTVRSEAEQILMHPFALFLGGDHSVTIPLVSALNRVEEGTKIGVVHVDAHPDLADRFEGHRWSHACTARRILEFPTVDPGRLAFVGTRSFMDGELRFLDDNESIDVHTARSLHLEGIGTVASRVCEKLQDADSVYVTVDIDVLDPSCAPGTGTPEAAGLQTRDLLEFLRVIFAQLPVRAMDIVEVCPSLDHGDITSVAAARIAYEAFGWVKYDQLRLI